MGADLNWQPRLREARKGDYRAMDRLNPGFKFLAILILGILLSFSFNARVNLGVFGASLALTLASSNLNYKKFFAWLSLFVLAAAGFL